MGESWGRRQGGGTFIFSGVALSRRPGLILNFRCQRRRTRNRVKVLSLSRRWRRLDRDAHPRPTGEGGVGFGGSSPAADPASLCCQLSDVT